jgi:hypothetical protein
VAPLRAASPSHRRRSRSAERVDGVAVVKGGCAHSAARRPRSRATRAANSAAASARAARPSSTARFRSSSVARADATDPRTALAAGPPVPGMRGDKRDQVERHCHALMQKPPGVCHRAVLGAAAPGVVRSGHASRRPGAPKDVGAVSAISTELPSGRVPSSCQRFMTSATPPAPTTFVISPCIRGFSAANCSRASRIASRPFNSRCSASRLCPARPDAPSLDRCPAARRPPRA